MLLAINYLTLRENSSEITLNAYYLDSFPQERFHECICVHALLHILGAQTTCRGNSVLNHGSFHVHSHSMQVSRSARHDACIPPSLTTNICEKIPAETIPLKEFLLIYSGHGILLPIKGHMFLNCFK